MKENDGENDDLTDESNDSNSETAVEQNSNSQNEEMWGYAGYGNYSKENDLRENMEFITREFYHRFSLELDRLMCTFYSQIEKATSDGIRNRNSDCLRKLPQIQSCLSERIVE